MIENVSDFSAESIFFYPIIAKILHKLFFSTFLYLPFSFQNIKYNYNDLDTMYKRPNDYSNKKMHLFDL